MVANASKIKMATSRRGEQLYLKWTLSSRHIHWQTMVKEVCQISLARPTPIQRPWHTLWQLQMPITTRLSKWWENKWVQLVLNSNSLRKYQAQLAADKVVARHARRWSHINRARSGECLIIQQVCLCGTWLKRICRQVELEEENSATQVKELSAKEIKTQTVIGSDGLSFLWMYSYIMNFFLSRNNSVHPAFGTCNWPNLILVLSYLLASFVPVIQ